MDREHVAEHHRVQRLSWREVGWTLFENQFGPGRKHTLHRFDRRRWNDLLLRHDFGRFEQRRERLFQSDNGRDSATIVLGSVEIPERSRSGSVAMLPVHSFLKGAGFRTSPRPF